MGKAYDGKKRWNETVLQVSKAPRLVKKKRLSGRRSKLSNVMKHVDAETRALVHNARLDALEVDNFGEDQINIDTIDEQDELYVDEEESYSPSNPNPKTNTQKSFNKKRAFNRAIKTKKFPVKSLAQLQVEQGIEESPYLAAAAGPSQFPSRKFCSVCGFFANYSCVRCGSRFCCSKCGDQHRETTCLKFGL